MSDKITIFYNALWIAHPILQTAIAVAMFRRERYRQFKFFFAYIIAQILAFAVVFPTYRYAPTACLYLSWFSTAISVALGFKVIHEAFLDAFRPFHTLRDLGTVLFKWAGLVMLLVAGVVSVSTNSSDSAPWVEAILTAQRCVRIIQVGMVLFLLFFARYLGVSRRQYSFGVALGFGCFAMVELSVVASWVGDHLNNLSMGLVNMAAYNCTLLIWLGYTLAKSPAREAASTLSVSYTHLDVYKRQPVSRKDHGKSQNLRDDVSKEKLELAVAFAAEMCIRDSGMDVGASSWFYCRLWGNVLDVREDHRA